MSAWETSLGIIHYIQNSGGLLHQIALSLSLCGEDRDHTKNRFHRWLFVFYINRSVTHERAFFCFLEWGFWSRRTSFFFFHRSHTSKRPRLDAPLSRSFSSMVGVRKVVRSLERFISQTAPRTTVRIKNWEIKKAGQHGLQRSPGHAAFNKLETDSKDKHAELLRAASEQSQLDPTTERGSLNQNKQLEKYIKTCLQAQCCVYKCLWAVPDESESPL